MREAESPYALECSRQCLQPPRPCAWQKQRLRGWGPGLFLTTSPGLQATRLKKKNKPAFHTRTWKLLLRQQTSQCRGALLPGGTPSPGSVIDALDLLRCTRLSPAHANTWASPQFPMVQEPAGLLEVKEVRGMAVGCSAPERSVCWHGHGGASSSRGRWWPLGSPAL